MPTAGSAEVCNLRVRWVTQPPFFQKDLDGTVTGFHGELIRAVAQRIGCGVTFIELPWTRALAYVRSGDIDVLGNATRTPEREEFAVFVRSPVRSSTRLFFRRGDAARFKMIQLADIAGSRLRVGVENDAVYSEDYRRLSLQSDFASRLTKAQSSEGLWKMLAAGRIDLVISDLAMAKTEIERAGLTAMIEPGDRNIGDDAFYFMLSRRSVSQDIVNRFAGALTAMERDGSLAEIVDPTFLPH